MLYHPCRNDASLSVSAGSDVLPVRRARVVLIAWAVLAAANLSAAVVIASLPERQLDLDSVRGWVQQWLIDGTNLYAVADARTDYPPYAIVAFTPLAVLPADWMVPAWAAFNFALALLAPYLALRIARPDLPFRGLLLPLLMFLCWGGTRTLLQFSLLALVSGLLAMMLAGRRPGWSGLCLALAMMKPQIAAPFVLWAIFTRQLRVIAMALFVVAAGVGIYCVFAHTDPLTVLRGYIHVLGELYLINEDLRMVGLSQLRPLILLAMPNSDLASAVAVAAAISLLAVIVIVGIRERLRGGEMISAPPLAAVWSLLTFYHLTYGFLLLLPVATLLMFMNHPQTRSLRRAVFWIMQAALMFDIPGMWPRLAAMIFPDGIVPFAALADHADRVLMAALFVCLVVVWRMRMRVST